MGYRNSLGGLKAICAMQGPDLRKSVPEKSKNYPGFCKTAKLSDSQEKA